MPQDSQLTSAQYCFQPEISLKSLTPRPSIELQLLTLGSYPKRCRAKNSQFFQAELLQSCEVIPRGTRQGTLRRLDAAAAAAKRSWISGVMFNQVQLHDLATSVICQKKINWPLKSETYSSWT